MGKRRLVLAGIVAAAMAAAGALGAIAFTPRVGEAAAGSTTAEATTASTSDDVDRPWERCARVAGAVGFGIRPLAVAADAIGIETAELLEAVHDGETIAEVAERQGVDPADVVDAIVAEERDRVEEAVANGRLTQEQADRLLASAEERATNLVERDHAGWPFPRRGGHGMAWPWGPGEGPIAAALEELGIDLPELLDGLREGQTIAEMAEELGVGHDAVVDESL
ncbi:MAG TPA: Clp protease N-terminal domain-containing protein [Actinomycetota bacterium]